jgi:hypothetical protein
MDRLNRWRSIMVASNRNHSVNDDDYHEEEEKDPNVVTTVARIGSGRVVAEGDTSSVDDQENENDNISVASTTVRDWNDLEQITAAATAAAAAQCRSIDNGTTEESFPPLSRYVPRALVCAC